MKCNSNKDNDQFSSIYSFNYNMKFILKSTWNRERNAWQIG